MAGHIQVELFDFGGRFVLPKKAPSMKPNVPQFNLASPNSILGRCDHLDIDTWFQNELTALSSASLRDVVMLVCANLPEFVSWPSEALLLWRGCDRIPEPGKSQKYHRYPTRLKELAAERGIDLDTRPNGPAIAAFQIAGGRRPGRFGSSNAWSIHHLYSGKFPHHRDARTLHAAKDGLHFTQSAGLVAVHPIADSLCDEFPLFTWRLRAEAFIRFGYDPDGIFAQTHDLFGFSGDTAPRVIHENA